MNGGGDDEDDDGDDADHNMNDDGDDDEGEERDGDTLRGKDWCLGCHPYTSKARTVFAMAHPALALNGRRCSG